MNKPACNECAFSKNGAGKEPYNSLRATVCALGAIPFGCHHGTNWENSNTWTPEQIKAALREHGMCQGWKARVQELNGKGWYGEYREIRRIIAAQLLKLIDAFVSEKDRKDKEKYLTSMRRMLKFLATKDIAHEEIPF